MEFEYLEYEFAEDTASMGRRVSALLAKNGYQSLQAEVLDLAQRYLPGSTDSPDASGELIRARTVDVLIPPVDPNARILVCERPGDAPNGAAVSVVAVGRTQEDAHRSRTAVKIVLDSKGAAEVGLPPRAANDNGRTRVRYFRQEWARNLGLLGPDAQGDAGPVPAPRSLAAVRMLFALQDASQVLGRSAVLRSAREKIGEAAPAGVDAALLDGLVPEGLVDRSFVLVCRESGQIVGVGKDAMEVQAAMQLTLRCPHCRRPLGEETQDVLYSLTTQGEEFVRSTRWIREAVESSLRKRSCDTIMAADGVNGKGVDGAACYQEAVLLFRVKDGAPTQEDVGAFQRAVAEFETAAPGVPVRGLYIAAEPAPPDDAQIADPRAALTVLEIAHFEESLDRVLEGLKRDNFVRLTGTTLQLLRPDPSALLAPAPLQRTATRTG